jgi:hypothetical protein
MLTRCEVTRLVAAMAEEYSLFVAKRPYRIDAQGAPYGWQRGGRGDEREEQQGAAVGQWVVPIRVSREQEADGLDLSRHREFMELEPMRQFGYSE